MGVRPRKVIFSCALICELIIVGVAFTAGYFYGRASPTDQSRCEETCSYILDNIGKP